MSATWRVILFVFLLLALFAGGPGAHRSGRAVDLGQPIIDPDGTVIGYIHVDTWSDTGSAANTPGTCCELGTATLTMTVSAEHDLVVDLTTFWAYDTASLKAVAKLPDSATAATGTLDVPAGSSQTFTLVFLYQSLDVTDSGTSIARVIWYRTATNLINLVSRIEPLPPTTDVLVQASSNQAFGVFRVDSFADPLTGIRKSSEPPKGFRAIGVTLTVQVDPGTSISFTPDDFILVDRNGQIYVATDTVKRLNRERHGIPVLDGTTVLNAGAIWSGFLAFLVPDDAVITDIYFRSAPAGSGGNLQPIMHIEFAD